jgi:type II secretory pathway pseudopilin PulG
MRTLAAKPPAHRTGEQAFTMIEIALSLAVIAFALVAVIGVIPMGMSAQKENREETIINQDASIYLQALRNGEVGLDALTNGVIYITNWVTRFNENNVPQETTRYWYTYRDSSHEPKTPINSGARIVGLLSRPKFIYETNGTYYSNYTIALCRSLSGLASEKSPQTNAEVQEMALQYRLIPDVAPYTEFATNNTWFTDPRIKDDPQEIQIRSNYWRVMVNMQTNLWDVRLRFQWPLMVGNRVGDGRAVYRSMVSGRLLQTNDYYNGWPLYQFEPRTMILGL